MILLVVLTVLYLVVLLFFFAMWGRFILDLVPVFSRQWRPRGFLLVVAETVYTVTDPPVRFVRGLIPPFRIGGISLDFGWSIVMLVVLVLLYVVSWGRIFAASL